MLILNLTRSDKSLNYTVLNGLAVSNLGNILQGRGLLKERVENNILWVVSFRLETTNKYEYFIKKRLGAYDRYGCSVLDVVSMLLKIIPPNTCTRTLKLLGGLKPMQSPIFYRLNYIKKKKRKNV